ncbi:MAG: electron transfer flavoprotein subunit alpha, partial [Muribaculaceae bacterium]|nr:electron transfer flavoprotein subunit alpha [Muribaculaceae bacterium]
MADNNNLIVYCEYDEGRVADVSLELLTKGRVLADRLGVKLEALVIGDKLTGIEDQIFPYGADTVYKVEDSRLFPYTSNPHAAVLIKLFKEIQP